MKSLKAVTKLIETIEKAKHAYDAGEETMTDAAYDALVAKLTVLWPEHPLLKKVESVLTSRTVTHLQPALSLDKTTTESGLVEWAASVRGIFVIQPKLDGMSLVLQYNGGRLVSAASRGDGAKGDRIPYAHEIPSVPNVSSNKAHYEVRGEVVIPLKTFREKYSKTFANPRNMVAGVLRSKTLDKALLKDLRFLAYDTSLSYADEAIALPALEDLGFDVAETRAVSGEGGLWQSCEDWMAERDEFLYECDGLVIKANGRSERNRLGATEHHPRWAIALKFAGESNKTKVLDVEWQCSRTGTLTPVAIVEPVTLSGAVVRRATLHTYARFEAFDLRSGSTVLMSRRGGVIPHIEARMDAGSVFVLQAPKVCPCGAAARIEGDFLMCSKPSACIETQIAKLCHWASVLDMQGWGRETLERLYLFDELRTVADFYTVTMGDLKPFFGETTTAKLLAEVKREMPFNLLIQGLGIEGVGKTASRKIIRELGTMHKLIEWSRSPTSIKGIGPAVHKQLQAGIIANYPLLRELEKHVTVLDEQPRETTGPFAGKAIVFTGALSDMQRTDAQALVRKLGGTTPDGVTKETNILVVGDGAKEALRGKRDKATKYGITIWSEQDWVDALVEADALG